jgi:predicted phage-related endonuclease
MKIVDEYHMIDNKAVKKVIKENTELIRDIVHMQHDLVNDYARYRILKALDKIETYNKEIK